MNYEWQKQVIEDIDDNQNILLQMPRRAGKTEVVRQIIRRRVQASQNTEGYQSMVVVVPNFSQVSHYLSILNDMFTRIGVHATRDDRMVSGRNFTIRFISSRNLESMRGLQVNLIIVDDADHMNLTNEDVLSIFRPCLVRDNGTILMTATNQRSLFKSVLESPNWSQNFELVFHREHINEWIAGILQWGMKNHSRDNLVSFLKDVGFYEDIKLHDLNKNLKTCLITY